MDGKDYNTWVRPNTLAKRPKPKTGTDSKKRLREEDNTLHETELPEKKRNPAPFATRKQSIFTLSSSESQIADEQLKIKDAMTDGTDFYIFKRTDGEDTANVNKDGKNTKSEKWHENLCVDWSLKSNLKISTKNTFAWSSNHLKSSEESSGVSAFVRCIDLEPLASQESNPQIDSSLGGQFHQCCLYWQYPYIPSLTLFPRDLSSKDSSSSSRSFGSLFRSNSFSSSSSQSSSPTTKFDDKVLESIHLEWVEAVRSLFQLLRVRQSPFFYVCSNTFTCLFCAAGTRNDQIQVYFTQATKAFRDLLKKEGINFSTPYLTEEKEESEKLSRNNSMNEEKDSGFVGEDDNAENFDMVEAENEDDVDEIAEKWLEDLGVSQDVTISSSFFGAFNGILNQKIKPTLVLITGSDVLPFFNFLINTRSLLRSTSGPLSGFPPTLLSPVAFHGACLRSVKVKQSKVINEKGEKLNLIDLTGPILPNVLHMLCPLLSKTVQEYKIHVTTVDSTVSLNMEMETPSNSDSLSQSTEIPNAFDIQNLSDCGLGKAILTSFCKCNNCFTIKESLSRKNGLLSWK